MAPSNIDPSYYVRKCTHDDLAAVMNVNETCLPENYPLFFYEEILEKYPSSFLVACTNNGGKELIVGYIMWRLERGISEFGVKIVKKGHLVSLAVMNNVRRHGVASQLLTHGMAAIQAYGAREFVLEVRISNMPAIKLYTQGFNFEQRKVIAQYYRDSEDAFFMARQADGHQI
jgi:ribosomal-protein-alanine N-acetyltransferase